MFGSGQVRKLLHSFSVLSDYIAKHKRPMIPLSNQNLNNLIVFSTVPFKTLPVPSPPLSEGARRELDAGASHCVIHPHFCFDPDILEPILEPTAMDSERSLQDSDGHTNQAKDRDNRRKRDDDDDSSHQSHRDGPSDGSSSSWRGGSCGWAGALGVLLPR